MHERDKHAFINSGIKVIESCTNAYDENKKNNRAERQNGMSQTRNSEAKQSERNRETNCSIAGGGGGGGGVGGGGLGYRSDELS